MAAEKLDVLMVGPVMPLIEQGIERAFTLHKLWEAPDRAALIELGLVLILVTLTVNVLALLLVRSAQARLTI